MEGRFPVRPACPYDLPRGAGRPSAGNHLMYALATSLLTRPLILLADTTDDRSPFVKFFFDDWYISIPMILMSLAGIWMVGWRLLLNYNGATVLSEFLPVFQEKLKREG